MRASDALETMELIGASQWGLITTQQAAAGGVERIWLSRLAQQETLIKVRYGIYALPSSIHDIHQEIHAAWISTDMKRTAAERKKDKNPVVVSHLSAAEIYRLGDVLPSKFELTSVARKQTSQKDMKIHQAELGDDDVDFIDGLPITSVERTLIDLAETVNDLDHYAEIVRDGIASRKVNIVRFMGRLNAAARKRGFKDGAAFYKHLKELAPPGDETQQLAQELGTYSSVDVARLAGFKLPIQNIMQPYLEEIATRFMESYRKAWEENMKSSVGLNSSMLEWGNSRASVPLQSKERRQNIQSSKQKEVGHDD